MLSLVGCGTGTSNKYAASPAVAVKDPDTQLTTEFTKEGVRVFYTLSGEVDRVEARASSNFLSEVIGLQIVM